MAYRRLLPRERGIYSYAELWAEDDHLLSVKSTRINVEYQRFPLRGVQAISITTLPHWTWPQIAWLLSSGAVLIATALVPISVLRMFLAAFTVWPFVLAVRELMRGPRCRTFIHTVTGSHALPAVSRQNRVPEFLDLVTPMIEGVQGRAESLRVAERPLVHPEEAAREALAKDRGLRLFALGALSALGLCFVGTAWWANSVTYKEGVLLLGAGAIVATITVLITVWRRATPLMRRDRVYVLTAAALAFSLAEIVAALAGAAMSMAGFGFRLPFDSDWLSAAWRLPLAAAALALELRRK